MLPGTLLMIFFSLALAANFFAVHLMSRYLAVRAKEMGMSRDEACSIPPIDYEGTSKFERDIFWELLFGQYETSVDSTLTLGRKGTVATWVAFLMLLLSIYWFAKLDEFL